MKCFNYNDIPRNVHYTAALSPEFRNCGVWYKKENMKKQAEIYLRCVHTLARVSVNEIGLLCARGNFPLIHDGNSMFFGRGAALRLGFL